VKDKTQVFEEVARLQVRFRRKAQEYPQDFDLMEITPIYLKYLAEELIMHVKNRQKNASLSASATPVILESRSRTHCHLHNPHPSLLTPHSSLLSHLPSNFQLYPIYQVGLNVAVFNLPIICSSNCLTPPFLFSTYLACIVKNSLILLALFLTYQY
jgi:hypothetical protein